MSIQWCYRFPWQTVSLPSRGTQTCAKSDVAIIVESIPKTIGDWVQWMFLILFNPIQEYFDVSFFSPNFYLWRKRTQEWGQVTMFNEETDLKLTLKDWCQSKLALMCFWIFERSELYFKVNEAFRHVRTAVSIKCCYLPLKTFFFLCLAEFLNMAHITQLQWFKSVSLWHASKKNHLFFSLNRVAHGLEKLSQF